MSNLIEKACTKPGTLTEQEVYELGDLAAQLQRAVENPRALPYRCTQCKQEFSVGFPISFCPLCAGSIEAVPAFCAGQS